MVSIPFDDQTAKALERQAQAAGLSITDFVRSLLPASPPSPRPTWDEIERQFEQLSSTGSQLPADFSRADFYGQHD